jgi:hypothetical protein
MNRKESQKDNQGLSISLDQVASTRAAQNPSLKRTLGPSFKSTIDIPLEIDDWAYRNGWTCLYKEEDVWYGFPSGLTVSLAIPLDEVSKEGPLYQQEALEREPRIEGEYLIYRGKRTPFNNLDDSYFSL